MIKKGSESDETFSIVIIGTNFLSSGLSYKEIVNKQVFPEEFLEDINIELLTPAQLFLSTSAIVIDISQGRIMLTTSDASQKYPLRDYFFNLLNAFSLEDKIKQIGFNFSRRIYCANADEWHRVGHKIMPKTIWKKIYKTGSDDVEYGLQDYSVRIQDPSRKYPGHTLIKITPMQKLSLKILVNEHVEYKEILDEDKFDTIFNVEWDSAFKRATILIDEFDGEM